MDLKKINVDKAIPIVIAFIIGFGISYFGGFSGNTTAVFANDSANYISTDAAAQRAVDYIESLGYEVTLKNVVKENNVYKLDLTISDGASSQDFISYVSLDGALLFPQYIELDNVSPAPSFDAPDTDVPNVKLFVMAFCPYGQSAMSAMKPVVDLLGEKIDVEIHYLFSGDDFCPNIASRLGISVDECKNSYCIENGTLCSLHGLPELFENVRQMCILHQNKDKFWDYVIYVNSHCARNNIDTCWQGAAGAVGLDATTIAACAQNQAAPLINAEMALADQYEAAGSPTIIINEVKYDGQRSAEAIKKAICSAFTTVPDECSQELSDASTSSGGSC